MDDTEDKLDAQVYCSSSAVTLTIVTMAFIMRPYYKSDGALQFTVLNSGAVTYILSPAEQIMS